MSVEAELRTALLAVSGVSTLIGSRMREGAKDPRVQNPCVTFNRVSTLNDYTHDGIGNLGWSRFQFDVWSPDAEQARTVANLLVAGIATFDLSAEPTSPATIFTESPNRLLNRWSDHFTQSEPVMFRVGLDFQIWHRESEE